VRDTGNSNLKSFAPGVIFEGAKMQDDENRARPSRASFFPHEQILRELSSAFFDESFCRKWILQKLYPTGAVCPKCGSGLSAKTERQFWSGKRFKCQSCGGFSTALTGSFLSGSQFSFAEIVILALMLSLTSWDRQIAEVLAVHPQTIKMWRLKFNAFVEIKAVALFPGRYI